ncbi:hypothetical protein VSR69_16600 [Paraburkholderia phytofirmans]|uniref:hypothetical protein n=1 Tax=Paraburkholderia sp. BL9I2N2 TaxID=1938809 RepID=UPI001051921D|nr:hypothetical protein [Paraburkholderia sp. BL9I2N2]TCK94753.1 hypothetical protein B0G74_1352 [Paraburkholderia sp. BL9I2N2]
MDHPGTAPTSPIISRDAAMWFSAYGFGWEYCAFALPAETVREKLRAASETPRQLTLAFELGRLRILQAVQQKTLPATGERAELSAADL